MKLAGTKTESDFRKELERSNVNLQDPSSRLRQVLQSHDHNTENAYVLHWTPDQFEDIYTVLINGSYLVRVEIDKDNHSKHPAIERIELAAYTHGLSKINQLRLAVARGLACT